VKLTTILHGIIPLAEIYQIGDRT